MKAPLFSILHTSARPDKWRAVYDEWMAKCVRPEDVDDLAAARMARDIVSKIEETLEYPGQIKVMVIREKRVVDYAK